MGDEAPALLRLWTTRAELRARVLKEALALESFVAGMGDPASGSWVDRTIRWEDIGPPIREWRDGVDRLSIGAAEIGDRDLSRMMSELARWKEPIAELLRAPGEPEDVAASFQKPEGARTVAELLPRIIERLVVLTRRARRTEFFIGPIVVVVAAAAIAGLSTLVSSLVK